MPLFSRKPSTLEIDPQGAHTLQSGGATLIDVREDFEWAGGHAAGARHIPLGSLAISASRLPKDKAVLVICASGNRSLRAAEYLSAQGWDAKSVSGGTAAWARAGLPLER